MTQDDAQYRVTLKRIVRGATGIVDKEADNATLEAAVRRIAAVSPAIVARGLDRAFESAARAWTRGNNSGNNATLEVEKRNCDRYRRGAERVLALWGVTVAYPGLYPCFSWHARHYHCNCESLLRDIAELFDAFQKRGL